MVKYILSIFFAFVLATVAPVKANAAIVIETIEQDQQPAVGVVNESTVLVNNANGLIMYVYNVAGVVVQTIKIEGQSRHYDLNLPKGCYIIKVGKVVRKISIK